jgi:hypothetical protein
LIRRGSQVRVLSDPPFIGESDRFARHPKLPARYTTHLKEIRKLKVSNFKRLEAKRPKLPIVVTEWRSFFDNCI